MTTIELPDEQAVALKAMAAAQGLTLESWFKKLAEEKASLANLRKSRTRAPSGRSLRTI